MTTHLFATFAAINSDTLMRLSGRLHAPMVHFPIALLSVAALLEFWQMLRGRSKLADATPVLLVISALSAVVAASFGWIQADVEGYRSAVVTWHRWTGIAAAVVSVLAMVLIPLTSGSTGVLRAQRLIVFIGAALVGLTGYLGGDVMHGKNHLFKGTGIFDEPEEEQPSPQPSIVPVVANETPSEFETKVAPILKQYCFRCHGGREKPKGGYSLKTRALALKGGGSDMPGIVPGQPDQSPLFTSIIASPDSDLKMPPEKEKQPSKEEIEIVRKWIADGAAWPDGFEVK
jgi:uncharacterized membrane protein